MKKNHNNHFPDIEGLERELWKLRNEQGAFSHLIHEDILQVMVATKNFITLASEKQTYDENLCHKICDLMDEAINKLKLIHEKVAFHSIKSLGLKGAVFELVNKVKKDYNIDIDFDIEESKIDSVDEYTKLLIHQILTELVKNTAYHSNSKEANIKIDRQKSILCVEYKDSGYGFYNSEKFWRSGLNGVKHSIYTLNGEMKIETSPGTGFFFKALIPIA
ncbi:MAG: hypothetical protein EBR19_05680 [Chitinophagaceae bacterium]|jgi:two-component system, chemotaxis family, CheB/CheR fusion protein|nr:hypothetical protein [Chitinophagaceae bacterium]